MRTFFQLGLAIFLGLGLLTPASAALIVDIGSTTIAQGGVGSIDVLLSSDSDTDFLWAYGVEFEITTGSGRLLDFVQTGGIPPDSQLGDANYVFASTGSSAISHPPVGAVGPNTTYLGLDISDDPLGVQGPFSHLLAHLELTAATASPPQIGDVFRIDLVATGFTFFLDSGPQDLDFTSNLGRVEIVAPVQSVPEPSSRALLGLGSLLLVAGRQLCATSPVGRQR